MSLKRLKVEKKTGYLFFRNPPLPQISIFSIEQKRCAYYGRSAYYEFADYERSQYLYIIKNSYNKNLVSFQSYFPLSPSQT